MLSTLFLEVTIFLGVLKFRIHHFIQEVVRHANEQRVEGRNLVNIKLSEIIFFECNSEHD